MMKTVAESVRPSPLPGGGPCDLAGAWVPIRHDEWRNWNLGSHKARARAPNTKVTYNSQGQGSGWVGEFYLQYSVTTVAPGQYTAIAKTMLWKATDGNLTLLQDGTLKVEYPSNGIIEYWRRAGGGGAVSATASTSTPPRISSTPARPIKLILRHFGYGSPFGSSTDINWHWGIAVGHEDHCYEVQGSMVVLGPKGAIAASSPFAVNTKPTDLSQFDAYLALPQKTDKSDKEIETFSRQWVSKHPVYNVLGPNCQTYAEDLFTFLCGLNLPFPKSASRVNTYGRGEGPEHHPSTHWLKPDKKPS